MTSSPLLLKIKTTGPPGGFDQNYSKDVLLWAVQQRRRKKTCDGRKTGLQWPKKKESEKRS